MKIWRVWVWICVRILISAFSILRSADKPESSKGRPKEGEGQPNGSVGTSEGCESQLKSSEGHPKRSEGLLERAMLWSGDRGEGELSECEGQLNGPDSHFDGLMASDPKSRNFGSCDSRKSLRMSALRKNPGFPIDKV